MIKSALMNRKLWLCLFVLLLLSGCGPRPEPVVEHFQGEVVATLQKPISQTTPEPLDTSLPPSEETELTPQASQSILTNTPGSTLTATIPNSQTTSYPVVTGTPTATLPNPQTTSYPVITGTPTLVPEPSATTSLTQTLTSTPGGSAWGGVWKIWYQMINGGYTLAELTLQVDGTRVTGAAKIDGIDYTFKGDIDTQGTRVAGKWQAGSDEGNYSWRMNSGDTFVGSRENRFGFCGNRATAIQPNPCREVPQN